MNEDKAKKLLQRGGQKAEELLRGGGKKAEELLRGGGKKAEQLLRGGLEEASKTIFRLSKGKGKGEEDKEDARPKFTYPKRPTGRTDHTFRYEPKPIPLNKPAPKPRPKPIPKHKPTFQAKKMHAAYHYYHKYPKNEPMLQTKEEYRVNNRSPALWPQTSPRIIDQRQRSRPSSPGPLNQSFLRSSSPKNIIRAQTQLTRRQRSRPTSPRPLWYEAPTIEKKVHHPNFTDDDFFGRTLFQEKPHQFRKRVYGPAAKKRWGNNSQGFRKIKAIDQRYEQQTEVYETHTFNPQYLADRALELTNDYRAKKGLPPLRLSRQMQNIAAEHAREMADGLKPFGHEGFYERARAFAPNNACAENLAFNFGMYDTAKCAVSGWIHSVDHEKNLIGNYDACGIGVAKSKEGQWYFTQLFSNTQEEYTLNTKGQRMYTLPSEMRTQTKDKEVEVLKKDIQLHSRRGKKTTWLIVNKNVHEGFTITSRNSKRSDWLNSSRHQKISDWKSRNRAETDRHFLRHQPRVRGEPYNPHSLNPPSWWDPSLHTNQFVHPGTDNYGHHRDQRREYQNRVVRNSWYKYKNEDQEFPVRNMWREKIKESKEHKEMRAYFHDLAAFNQYNQRRHDPKQINHPLYLSMVDKGYLPAWINTRFRLPLNMSMPSYYPLVQSNTHLMRTNIRDHMLQEFQRDFEFVAKHAYWRGQWQREQMMLDFYGNQFPVGKRTYTQTKTGRKGNKSRFQNQWKKLNLNDIEDLDNTQSWYHIRGEKARRPGKRNLFMNNYKKINLLEMERMLELYQIFPPGQDPNESIKSTSKAPKPVVTKSPPGKFHDIFPYQYYEERCEKCGKKRKIVRDSPKVLPQDSDWLGIMGIRGCDCDELREIKFRCSIRNQIWARPEDGHVYYDHECKNCFVRPKDELPPDEQPKKKVEKFQDLKVDNEMRMLPDRKLSEPEDPIIQKTEVVLYHRPGPRFFGLTHINFEKIPYTPYMVNYTRNFMDTIMYDRKKLQWIKRNTRELKACFEDKTKLPPEKSIAVGDDGVALPVVSYSWDLWVHGKRAKNGAMPTTTDGKYLPFQMGVVDNKCALANDRLKDDKTVESGVWMPRKHKFWAVRDTDEHSEFVDYKLGSQKLHQACAYGDEGSVRLLLVNPLQNPNGYRNSCPLFAAAYGGYEKICKLLLEYDAFPSGYESCCPLFQSACRGDEKIIEMLLEAKADPDGYEKCNPLHQACSGLDEKIVEKLLDAKADPNGWTTCNPLYQAVSNGSIPLTQLLLKKKAHPDGYQSCNPIHMAASRGDKILVKMLLDKGANPSGYKHWNPLFVTPTRGMDKGNVLSLHENYFMGRGSTRHERRSSARDLLAAAIEDLKVDRDPHIYTNPEKDKYWEVGSKWDPLTNKRMDLPSRESDRYWNRMKQAKDMPTFFFSLSDFQSLLFNPVSKRRSKLDRDPIHYLDVKPSSVIAPSQICKDVSKHKEDYKSCDADAKADNSLSPEKGKPGRLLHIDDSICKMLLKAGARPTRNANVQPTYIASSRGTEENHSYATNKDYKKLHTPTVQNHGDLVYPVCSIFRKQRVAGKEPTLLLTKYEDFFECPYLNLWKIDCDEIKKAQGWHESKEQGLVQELTQSALNEILAKGKSKGTGEEKPPIGRLNSKRGRRKFNSYGTNSISGKRKYNAYWFRNKRPTTKQDPNPPRPGPKKPKEKSEKLLVEVKKEIREPTAEEKLAAFRKEQENKKVYAILAHPDIDLKKILKYKKKINVQPPDKIKEDIFNIYYNASAGWLDENQNDPQLDGMMIIRLLDNTAFEEGKDGGDATQSPEEPLDIDFMIDPEIPHTTSKFKDPFVLKILQKCFHTSQFWPRILDDCLPRILQSPLPDEPLAGVWKSFAVGPKLGGKNQHQAKLFDYVTRDNMGGRDQLDTWRLDLSQHEIDLEYTVSSVFKRPAPAFRRSEAQVSQSHGYRAERGIQDWSLGLGWNKRHGMDGDYAMKRPGHYPKVNRTPIFQRYHDFWTCDYLYVWRAYPDSQHNLAFLAAKDMDLRPILQFADKIKVFPPSIELRSRLIEGSAGWLGEEKLPNPKVDGFLVMKLKNFDMFDAIKPPTTESTDDTDHSPDAVLGLQKHPILDYKPKEGPYASLNINSIVKIDEFIDLSHTDCMQTQNLQRPLAHLLYLQRELDSRFWPVDEPKKKKPGRTTKNDDSCHRHHPGQCHGEVTRKKNKNSSKLKHKEVCFTAHRCHLCPHTSMPRCEACRAEYIQCAKCCPPDLRARVGLHYANRHNRGRHMHITPPGEGNQEACAATKWLDTEVAITDDIMPFKNPANNTFTIEGTDDIIKGCSRCMHLSARCGICDPCECNKKHFFVLKHRCDKCRGQYLRCEDCVHQERICQRCHPDDTELTLGSVHVHYIASAIFPECAQRQKR